MASEELAAKLLRRTQLIEEAEIEAERNQAACSDKDQVNGHKDQTDNPAQRPRNLCLQQDLHNEASSPEQQQQTTKPLKKPPPPPRPKFLQSPEQSTETNTTSDGQNVQNAVKCNQISDKHNLSSRVSDGTRSPVISYMINDKQTKQQNSRDTPVSPGQSNASNNTNKQQQQQQAQPLQNQRNGSLEVPNSSQNKLKLPNNRTSEEKLNERNLQQDNRFAQTNQQPTINAAEKSHNTNHPHSDQKQKPTNTTSPQTHQPNSPLKSANKPTKPEPINQSASNKSIKPESINQNSSNKPIKPKESSSQNESGPDKQLEKLLQRQQERHQNYEEQFARSTSTEGDVENSEQCEPFMPSMLIFNPYTEFKEMSRKEIQQYQKVFKQYDENNDKFIDFEELKRMMEKIGSPQTHLALKAMIREVDEDKDNKISFREFLLIFRKARAGELTEESELLELYRHVSVIDVTKEGIKGAANFFEAKVAELTESSKSEQEIKAEQQERAIAMQEKKERRAAFKATSQIFQRMQ